jgi:integrase
VPLPKVPRGLQPEVLEGPQLGELLKGIKGHDIEIAVALAAMTGMRMGEVLALRWSDVNFDSCILRVMRTLHSTKDGVPNIGPTKTHRSTRPIVIFEPLVTMLRAERQRQKGYAEVYGDNYRNYDLVCCMPDGRAWDKRNFYRRYRNLLHKLGLPEVTFHSLRHGFASIAGEKGVSMRQVSELLGHSQIAITADLYSHIFLEAKKETAGKLGKAFTEIVADNLADIQQKLQTNLDVTDESSSDSPRR